jgi:hypothetical protein
VRATPRVRWLLLLVLGVAACGDDSGDGTTPGIDAPVEIDAPVGGDTFTSFVIDLVTNQTAGNTDPRPFADFSGLDDPDQDNAGAYTSLFP